MIAAHAGHHPTTAWRFAISIGPMTGGIRRSIGVLRTTTSWLTRRKDESFGQIF